MSEVFTNTAKARLKKGEKLTAAWVQLGSPIAAEIMAQAGYDMLVVDCEHAPIDPSTLFPILQAVNGYETTAIARAPWNDMVAIMGRWRRGQQFWNVQRIGLHCLSPGWRQ